jgi:hypothetical protein
MYPRPVGRALALSLLSLVLVACLGDPAPDSPDAAPPGEGLLCPPADHPRVHYASEDPNDCAGIIPECTEEQTGFQNACGCGCIDKGDGICPDVFDPKITWVSHDPDECDGPPPCPLGDTAFHNTCGCGCITY